MSRLGWFVGLLISFSSVGVFADDLQPLSWLSGQWRSEKDGRISEEVWMRPEGSMMLGLNRMVFPSGKGAFEYLRIAPVDGKLSYVASPGGRPGTHFPLKEQTENRAVFENLDHDFPQRISYKLKGDVLEARIEGEVNGNLRAQSWRWERVGGEPKPDDSNDKSSAAVGLRTVVYKVNDLAQAKELYAKAFQKRPLFRRTFLCGVSRLVAMNWGSTPTWKASHMAPTRSPIGPSRMVRRRTSVG